MRRKKKRDKKLHKRVTWTSLWTWRVATSLKDALEKTFKSSAVKTLCTLSTTSSTSSQTQNEWESTFSFHLSVMCGFLEVGVGILSIEVAGEAVLAVLVSETIGVTEAVGVTGGPFFVTRTTLFPMLDNGSSLFDLIFAYMSLLNLVVIPARGKHLKKKKTSVYKGINTNEPNTYFFFPQYQYCAGWRWKALDQGNRRREFMGPQDRPSPQLTLRIRLPSSHAPCTYS